MMSIRLGSRGLLILVAISRAATAQDVSGLVADRDASAELEKIVAGAKQNGLPVNPIIAKIRYAVMMRTPAPRIVSAASGVASRLADARNALAPHPDSTDITAGENALGAGVSTKSLQEIRKVSPNKAVAVPVGVLAQLVASNVPEKKAAKYVTDLIKRGATADQLATLGNDVNADVTVLGAAAATNALEIRMKHLNAVLGVPGANGDAATAPTALQSGDGKKKP